MNFTEFLNAKNRFNYLFNAVCKKGFFALSEAEKAEYNALICALNDPKNADNQRAYHNAISAGIIRIGY